MNTTEQYERYNAAQKESIAARVQLYSARLETTGEEPVVGTRYYYFDGYDDRIKIVILLSDEHSAYGQSNDFKVVEDEQGMRFHVLPGRLIPIRP